ncbi:PAS domain S-box protein [Mucilaginibacter rubeus]|uniref:histidine kinase n=1 Tax=Mucilaginibacter rubeus TaxID=2027860 RepID=A0AAE6JF58_9SPHI|nr:MULTISPECIES: PAS domain S-box protein [Mucilaginibacter]QEM04261.1 PAS domain S-box protein [Mucilaginibacter rubeus]QEM16860.1 PAS domain S-box protein [Mucilaginibacter gossypii]QTE46652.1 PAS domain S-box protein [Mucilaginibacter rubeus]QTE53249.1 PAS domain S-box protein [Mucilaginibacter rubeus]QTE58336.1 PAS domain S-box protein [Mucilaginibacter rubeus]
MRKGAFGIAFAYLLISLLWIMFSDRLLFYFEGILSPNQYLWLSLGKGCLFVVVTAIALYALIRSEDQRLKQSEKQYRSMYESNPNPMWIYEPGTLRFISVNDAAIAVYGYSAEEFRHRTILDIRPLEDRENVISSSERVNSKLNDSGTWRHIKKDGQLIYVNITSHKIWFNKKPHIMVMIRDMTERVAFERALEKVNQELLEEKHKLSETQLLSRVAGWEFYPRENKLIWSDEVYRIAGLKRDGREAFDIYVQHIFPEDRPLMINALHDLISTGKQLDITHRITALDGTTRYIRQLARVESSGEQELKIAGSLQDITELKQLEMERNRYQYSFEHTLNSITDCFFELDHQMKITRINDIFREMVKTDRSRIIGASVFEFFPKAENKFYHVYQKALEERIIVRHEDYSVVLQRWLRMAAYPTDEGVAVYFADITEDRLKDERLKEAVERYELVAQATRDVVYDLNIVENKLVYNTSLTHLVQIPLDEISYELEWWRSLIHPDDMEEVVSSQEKISRAGLTNWECEYRLNCGKGEYKYVMDQGYFIYNEQKQPIRLIGAVRDIDALKRSTQENKRLARIIKQVNNMVLITDDLRRVQWVNNAFVELTGYAMEEVVNKMPGDFLTDPDNPVIQTLIRKQQAREAFGIDTIIYTKNRTPVWVSAQLTPAYDENNAFQGYIIVCQDITYRKEKEEEINRQNRLLREVAWISSHEIRRPVATMLGLVNLLDMTEDESERKEIFSKLRECAAEMDSMVHEIHRRIEAEKVMQIARDL